MSTNRTPREQPLRIEISEHAVGIFLKMEELRRACCCGPVDPKQYWKHEKCANCVARRKAHIELHNELRLKPWDMVLDLYNPGKTLWLALTAAAKEIGYPA